MSDAAKELSVLLKDQPETPLRPHQQEAYREEQRRLESIVKAPPYVTGVNRGLAHKKIQEVQKTIDSQMPRPVDGAEKDRIAHLADEVMQGTIRPAMLTKEEMRRNPAGAVGQFLKRESHPIVKGAVRLWKRAMFALEPQSQDPDLANAERFRPETGASTILTNAQIPGHMAIPEAAKANLPESMQQVPPTSPLGEARARDERHRMTGKLKG